MVRTQVLCVNCYVQNDSISSGVTNYILNGSFENSNCLPYPGGWSKFCPNSSAYNCNLANWTCTGGGASTYSCTFDNTVSVTPDGIRTAYFGNYFCNACSAVTDDVSCLLDSGCITSNIPTGYPLNTAAYGNGNGVTLSQTVTGLNPGSIYVLEFWVGGEDGFSNPGLFAVDVGFGKTYLRCNATPVGGIGKVYLIQFAAAASSHTISFTCWGHICSSCTELVLDNVRLYPIGQLSASVQPCITTFFASTASASAFCGQCNGTAYANAINGTSPYSYLWSNGQTTPTISSLCAGTYSVTTTDQAGDTAISSIVVGQSTNIPITARVNSTSCGYSNGTAVAVASGTGPYTYSWSNGATGDSVSNLAAGSYNVTVATSANCTASGSVNINSSIGVTLSTTALNATCNASNGGAVVSVVNGTGPFTYLWSTGAKTGSIGNVSAGTYTVTVTGSSNCTATIVATVGTSNGVTIQATSINTACGLSNGSATANVITGASPYTYSWSSGSTHATATNLGAGTYSVTVNDKNGCSATASVTVNTSSSGDSATITTNKPLFCATDSTEICVTQHFTSYSWNNGASTQCITTNIPGAYYVDVTDSIGCTTESNHLSVSVYPVSPVTVSLNGDSMVIYNSTIQQWYLNGAPINGATSRAYVVHQSGTYYVVATDTNGCTGQSSPIVISGTDAIKGEETVSVRPNPLAEGNWQILTGNSFIGSMVEILDADGRLVFESVINNSKTEITGNFSSGVYLLRISSPGVSVIRKLVKL